VANKGFDEIGRPVYEGEFPHGTPKAVKQQRILRLIQDVWSKKPLALNINEPDGTTRQIEARFDPTYNPADLTIQTDVSKLLAGNRHGSAKDRRVTLDLADDWYEIAETSTYDYSKAETGKSADTHRRVKEWHYFVNDIMFQEYGQSETSPYLVIINIKERDDGHFIYSISAESTERNEERKGKNSRTSSSYACRRDPKFQFGESEKRPARTG